MLMMPARPVFYLAIIAALLFSSYLSAQPAETTEARIGEGSLVSFNYILSDQHGAVIESNEGKEPMSYMHGKGQIIPGLEKELSGMKVGEQKKVHVNTEDGYGPVNPQAFQEVSKDKIPSEALKVGAMLMAQDPQGQAIPARVHEIKESTVIIDFKSSDGWQNLIV